jgi:transcriptional regulator with XRE-family HTH domain
MLKGKKLDAAKIETLKRLGEIGCTQEEIEHILGISFRTVRRNKKAFAEYKSGFSKGVANVRKTAYTMALSGESPALTIFFLKTKGKDRETNIIENKDTTDVERLKIKSKTIIDFKNLSALEAQKKYEEIVTAKKTEDS